jgi:hypothetical protein
VKRVPPLVWIALAHLGVLLAVYHRVWRGQMFYGWDCLREYWPDIVYGARSIGEGEAPWWNPFALGGYSFHGDPQAGVYSPMNWLCYLLSWITGSRGAWLIQVKVFLHMWLAAVAMHLLVLRREKSHPAAFVAGVVLILGSPYLVHKNGALVWPALVLPLALLALDAFLETPSLARGALLGAAVWFLGTAGHPHSFFMGLLVVFGYWAFRLAMEPRRAREQWKGALVFVGVTALLLLPLYLPAATAVAGSPRAHRGLTYVLQGSLEPARLNELVAPNLDTDWMKDIYMGAIALVAIACALVGAASRRERADRLFWLGMAIFGTLLALGSFTPLLPFLAKHVPGFGLFRIAYRHKLIIGFTVAILAGAGVASAHRARWVVAGGALAWMIAAGVLLGKVGWTILFGGASLALLVAAAFDSPRARFYLPAAALFVVADLWTAGISKVEIMQPPPQLAKDAPELAKMPGVEGDFRYWNDGVLPHHLPFLYDVRELSGFANPVVVERQELLVPRVQRTPALLRHFNVKWYRSRRNPGAGFRAAGPATWEVLDPVPIVRVYPGAQSVLSDRMLDMLQAPGELKTALVEVSDTQAPMFLGEGEPVDGRLVSYARNRIEVEVNAPYHGIAVLAENDYPHWKATIDGAETRIFRANYLNRAVVVPPGPHRIVFLYQPPAMTALTIFFFLGLAAAVLVVVKRW